MTPFRTARFWVISAAAAAGIAATFGLGTWQLGRAHQKLDLQAAIDGRHALPALDGRSIGAAPASELLHRVVVLRGHWDAAHTVYLDNRQMAGRQGFYVVTPLRLDDSNRIVAVQRGWAPRNFEDRAALPAVATPSGTVEFRGQVAPPPARLYEFRGADHGTIRQNLDLAAWRAETGLPLVTDLSVMQEGPPAEGLSRDWPPPALGVERHYGYVAQWWALSALIAILYVWFQFIAPRRTRRAA